MEDLSKLKLAELREEFPEIVARSKKEFLTKLAEAQEAVVELVEEFVDRGDNGPMDTERLLDYLWQIRTSKKKVLIKFPQTFDADNAWYTCDNELFPKLNREGITVMSSSTARDMHINGTLYVRFVCKTNYNHIKGLMRYTDFKEAF